MLSPQLESPPMLGTRQIRKKQTAKNVKFPRTGDARILLAFAAAVLAFVPLCASAQSPGTNAVRKHPLGLKPTTDAERAWIDREMRDTKRVLPNKLAIERLNRDRQAKGLPSISIPVVPVGQEVLSASDAGQSGRSAPWALADLSASSASSTAATTGLPSAVDNSTLGCFPPVGNQDELGSCASFAVGYYVGTHMLALARNIDARSTFDYSTKLSPKWLYSLCNGGVDLGSTRVKNMAVLLKLGAPSWQMFPYEGKKNVAANYLEWNVDPSVWRAAVANRFSEAGRVQNIDTAAGLNALKGLLANGYLLNYGTLIEGWQYTTFSDDPGTAADNALVGRQVCWKAENVPGSHAMTIVGYNDEVWVDINRNGVVDSGEKGALKIVNSWGTGWGDRGFMWIAYDALRAASGVSGADTSFNRVAAFIESEAYWLTARSQYTPALLAEFTLSHAQRNQLFLRVGSSSPALFSPDTYFPATTTVGPFSMDIFRGLGGPLAFNGGNAEADGTFVFDLTDVLKQGVARYYLVANDSTSGSPCTVRSLRLTTPGGQTLAAAAAGLPAVADASTASVWVDFNYQATTAPVVTSAAAAAASVGQQFSFQVAASNSPSSFAATGLPPGLAINASNGLISGMPSQAGTFAVAVSASNASGTGSATLTITVSASLAPLPQITSNASASGTVGQPFSYFIAATGSPSLYAAAPLPPGTTINPVTGLISGTPTQAGVFEMTVSAANAAGTGNKKVTVSIAAAAVSAPVITSADTASGTSGSNFSYRIQASNSPTSYGAQGLPSTLSLDPSTGVISGLLPAPRAYYITLSASNSGGIGYRQLVLTVAGNALFGPSNDALANAVVLNGASADANGTNMSATAEQGEPSHAGQTSHSVWWSWTAPFNGTVVIKTEGSNFDTVLAVYTGVSVAALSKVAEDDDGGALTSSLVQFNATAGTTYRIAVDGYGDAAGDISLSVRQTASAAPANDNFASRISLAGSVISINGSNANATSESGEPAHVGYTAAKSVWWTWTAPANGRVTLDTKGSSFDTLLAVYTGTAVSALLPLASDDQSGGGNASLVKFTAVQGTTYQIAVDGWLGDQGGIAMNLLFEQTVGPENDDFASARTLTGNSGGESASSRSATAESGEPPHFTGCPAARSLWWKWTAPSNGYVRWRTVGSSFDTVMGIYVGGSVSSLTRIASDDDSGGNRTSAAEFATMAGVTYYVAVDGYRGASGDVRIDFSYTAAPANDNFNAASSLAGFSATASGANANATAQTGEPSHAGSAAAHSLWWAWTPSRSASVLITTAGSNFDTVLGVYTGSALSSLRAVASNDDAGFSTTSAVAFFANAGTTYYLAVDGYGGRTGQIQLAVEQAEQGILYETDFESFPSGIDGMDGFDGWSVSDPETGSCGIFKPGGVSQAAWLGFNQTSADFSYIQRPVNYRPGPGDDGTVLFRADVTVYDSTADSNFRRDSFDFELVNIAGYILCSISFDNASGEILAYEGGTGWRSTGVYFANGDTRKLEFRCNLKTNRWSASWGERVLFTDKPLNNSGADLSVGGVDVTWYPAIVGAPGDNFVVLDNYRLSTRGPAPVITSAGEASGKVGDSFSYQIVASNAPGSFSAQGLPAGLFLDSASGLISGTPQQAGVFAVLLGATNDSGTGTKSLLLSVAAPPAPPVITSPLSASGKQGQFFSYQISASNAPLSFAASGVPAGLAFDSSTGLISGTPSGSGAFSVTISATNAGGTSAATLLVDIASAGPQLSITSVRILPAARSVKAGKVVKFMVSVANDSTQGGVVSINLIVDGPGLLANSSPLTIFVPGKKIGSPRPKFARAKFFVIAPFDSGDVTKITASVGSSLSNEALVLVK